MPLELAVDRRRRERRELQAPIGIEPLDRLEHPHERDLDQIVERLTPIRVATGQVRRERPVRLDQLVARPPVPSSAVLLELGPQILA